MSTLVVMVRRALIAAWRYRWAAAAVSWIVCGIGWTYVYLVPNSYEASARLYVDADAVLTPLLRGIAVDNTLTGQLDVLQRTLLSRPNLEKLVSNTDLDLNITGPADLETMVGRLGLEIKINPQTRNLFTITYRNTSAKLAFDVVQTILTTFIESKTGNNRSEMENAQLFLQQQLTGYERQLRDAERKRAEFRSKYLDLLPMGDTGSTRLDAAQAGVRRLQGELTDQIAKRETLNRELSTTPALISTETPLVVGPNGTVALAAKDPRLEAAQRELDDLRLRYTENHPDVAAARKRLESVQRGVAEDNAAAAAARTAAGQVRPPGNTTIGKPQSPPPPPGRSVPNPVYEKLKVQSVEVDSVIASLQRQIADATQERDRLEEMARSAPGVQAEFLNLNRDYDVMRRNYEELLARRESMRISTAAEADADKIKIQIIDPPQVPQNPVAPKRGLLISIVLAAGLAAGIGLAVLLVQFDQSFHTIDELRDLGLPVAGGVSMLNVTIARSHVTTALVFSMSLVLLCLIYAGLLYRILHTPGVI